jgi:NADH:ubiquinone oxidoreductase subunit E
VLPLFLLQGRLISSIVAAADGEAEHYTVLRLKPAVLYSRTVCSATACWAASNTRPLSSARNNMLAA